MNAQKREKVNNEICIFCMFFNLWLLMERRMHIDDGYKELQVSSFLAAGLDTTFYCSSQCPFGAPSPGIYRAIKLLRHGCKILRNGVLLTA